MLNQSVVVGLLKREWLMLFRRRHEWLQPLWFLMLVVLLFVLGIGPETELLVLIAPGIIWVGVLLATLLTLENLFQKDYDLGGMDYLRLSAWPLWWLIAAKLLAHWLLTGLPFVVLGSLLAFGLQVPHNEVWILLLSLLVGTPSISLLGGVMAALTVSTRFNPLLLMLLVAPLYLPVLIFAVGAVQAVHFGFNPRGQLAILAALLMVMLPLCIWVASLALGAQESDE